MIRFNVLVLLVCCFLTAGIRADDTDWGFGPTEEAEAVADWGFAPSPESAAIESDTKPVESANEFGLGVLARKVPTIEATPQQQVANCPGGVCPLPQTIGQQQTDWIMSQAPVSIPVNTVVSYGCTGASSVINYGCTGGFSVSNYAAPVAYRNMAAESHWLFTHLQGPPHNHSPSDLFGKSIAELEAMHDKAHGWGTMNAGLFNRGSGYGIFGNRERPLFWRVRPLARARMGW